MWPRIAKPNHALVQLQVSDPLSVVLLVVALAALVSEALELAEVHVKFMFLMWVP